MLGRNLIGLGSTGPVHRAWLIGHGLSPGFRKLPAVLQRWCSRGFPATGFSPCCGFHRARRWGYHLNLGNATSYVKSPTWGARHRCTVRILFVRDPLYSLVIFGQVPGKSACWAPWIHPMLSGLNLHRTSAESQIFLMLQTRKQPRRNDVVRQGPEWPHLIFWSHLMLRVQRYSSFLRISQLAHYGRSP